MTPTSDRAWAILIARTLLGLVFFVAGVYKTFMWGPLEHARVLFVEPYAQTYLPVWGLWASGAVIPIIELVVGALVLVGLWTRPSLFVLGGILIFVAFGHLVRQRGTSLNPFILPRSALLLIVLLTPAAADRYSLDGVRQRSRGHDAAAE